MQAPMVFDYTLKRDWPSLAWVASCPAGRERIEVLHGLRLETRPTWFCEAVWDGEFPAGEFHQTDIVAGTGASSREGAVTFVSSGSTVDRLQYFAHSDGLWISNSLGALLAAIGAHVDPTYPHYSDDLGSIVKGLRGFKADLQTSRGPVRLVYFHNVVWDGREVSERPKPNARRDFSSFDRYYAFLTAAMQSVAKNAADPHRAYPYHLVCPISNGYDSPTVATLARTAGCSHAFSFDVSREGIDDSGAKIGQLFRMKTTVISRDAWRDAVRAEIPFIAGAAGAGEVLFKGAEPLLGGAVLLSGFSGDSVWAKTPKRAADDFVRTDASGLCLTEYRLHVGFIHCPVPFWGGRQIEQISAISRSRELEPWDLGGRSDRPICRRIVEEAGVPREWFGHGKRGVSVQLFRPRHFLESRTVHDYYAWSAENAAEWRRRGRIRPRPLLAHILDAALSLSTHVLRFMLGIRPLRRIPFYGRILSALARPLQRPQYIRRYTFPWALARVQERYR